MVFIGCLASRVRHRDTVIAASRQEALGADLSIVTRWQREGAQGTEARQQLDRETVGAPASVAARLWDDIVV